MSNLPPIQSHVIAYLDGQYSAPDGIGQAPEVPHLQSAIISRSAQLNRVLGIQPFIPPFAGSTSLQPKDVIELSQVCPLDFWKRAIIHTMDTDLRGLRPTAEDVAPQLGEHEMSHIVSDHELSQLPHQYVSTFDEEPLVLPHTTSALMSLLESHIQPSSDAGQHVSELQVESPTQGTKRKQDSLSDSERTQADSITTAPETDSAKSNVTKKLRSAKEPPTTPWHETIPNDFWLRAGTKSVFAQARFANR